MPKVTESWSEFKERQGCEFIVTGSQMSVRSGNVISRIVFANGAVSDTENHYDPPTDRRTFLLVRKEFLQTKLKQEVREFDSFKSYCLNQANLFATYPYLPGPPADAPEQLRAGAERIANLREELARIEEELIDPRAAQQERHRRQVESAARSRNASIAAQIADIRI